MRKAFRQSRHILTRVREFTFHFTMLDSTTDGDAIALSKPIKKGDYYFAPIFTSSGQKVKLTLKKTKWVHLHPTEKDGSVLRIFIPHVDNSNIAAVKQIDEDVIQQVTTHNAEWFPNSLTEAQIRNYYRPSVSENQSTMSLFVSCWKEPVIWVNQNIYDNTIHSIPALYHRQDAQLEVEIEATGIMIKKTRFGIRWTLRKLWIHLPQEDPERDALLLHACEREDIENDWREDLADWRKRCTRREQEIHEEYQRQLHALKETREKVEDTFQQALACTDTQKWNEMLEKLAVLISLHR